MCASNMLRSSIASSLLLLVTLHLTFESGESIQCFDCNSHLDIRCLQDVPPEALKKNCSDLVDGAKFILCRKIVQSIEHEVNGLQPDTRVIRSCGWDNSSYLNKCYQRSGFGGRQEVCTCTTDLCNSAPVSAISFLLLPIILLIHKLL